MVKLKQSVRSLTDSLTNKLNMPYWLDDQTKNHIDQKNQSTSDKPAKSEGNQPG